MNQELPHLLYHYCSLQALRGIIQGKNLHMTNVFWMDDTTEVFWLYEVTKRVLLRKSAHERNALHEALQRLIDERRLSDVFCACFSKDPDSRSQWLEYADDGHGFAIGFDPNAFELSRPKQTRSVELHPVIYAQNEQESLADEVIRSLQAYGSEVAEKFALGAAHHNLWWNAARCKNPAFENEKEWRLIYRDHPGDRLEFRVRPGRHLIPFISFPIDPAKKPIREIWLGPRNQSPRNADAVWRLLRVSGYEVGGISFSGSEIPLRPEY